MNSGLVKTPTTKTSPARQYLHNCIFSFSRHLEPIKISEVAMKILKTISCPEKAHRMNQGSINRNRIEIMRKVLFSTTFETNTHKATTMAINERKQAIQAAIYISRKIKYNADKIPIQSGDVKP